MKEWLGNLRFASKMPLIAVIPIVSLSFFAMTTISGKRTELADIKQARAGIRLALALDEVVHGMQRERGLSAGFQTSDGTSFGQELALQRRDTDRRVDALRAAKAAEEDYVDSKLSGEIQALLERLGQRGQVRRAVDDHTPGVDYFRYYSERNTEALKSIQRFGSSVDNATMVQGLVALSSLLWGKEWAGKERAALGELIGLRQTDDRTLANISSYIALQNQHLEDFELIASNSQRALLQTMRSDPAFAEVIQMRTRALSRAGLETVDAVHWWTQASRRIDLLKEVSVQQAKQLIVESSHLTSQAYNEVLLSLSLVLGAGLFAISLAIYLARLVSKPLTELTEVAGQIAAGEPSKRVQVQTGDEVGELASAFNTMSENLESTSARLTQTMDNLRLEGQRLASAEAHVKVERSKLQSIVDCMSDAVIFGGPRGEGLLVNKAAGELWSEDDACARIVTWQAAPPAQRPRASHQSEPLIHINGRAFEPTFAPVFSSNSKSLGAVMVARDVTERLQEQRLRMEKERMATIGRLAAAVAHEVNNPLCSIELSAEHVLAGLAPDDPITEQLENVRHNSGLCKKTVRTLLEYSRRRAPERAIVDPEALLGMVVRTLGPKSLHAHVNVEVHIMPDTPCVHGDPNQLQQVFVNLGLNAIDAMPGGGTLRFSARSAGESAILFTVCDTGVGIPEEQREHVFSAFHTTKAEGTGLGLAVVRDIISDHNGQVKVGDAPEGGCAFSVLLPVTSDSKEPS